MSEKLLYLLTAFNLILYLYIAFQVSKKWRWGKAHRRFFILMLFVFSWVAIRFLEKILPVNFATIFFHFDFAFAAAIAGLMASFSIHFPKQNLKFDNKKEVLFFIPIIILIILSFTNTFFIPISSLFVLYHSSSYIYVGILIIYFILISGMSLIKKYFKNYGILQKQLGFFISGYFLAIVILLLDIIFISIEGFRPLWREKIDFNLFILFLAFAAYAIIKYRFLDITFAIRRGAVRLLSFVIIFGIYLFIILLLKDSLASINKESELTYLIIITLLVVLTVEPIRKLVYKYVDRVFETRDEKQKKVQILTQAIFTSTKNYEDLISSIIEVLKNITNVEQIRYAESTDAYFSTHKSTLECLRATGRVLVTEELPYRMNDDPRYPEAWKELQGEETSLFLPMGRAETYMGSFIFGKRKNHAAYTIQEIKELEGLQYKFGEALFNVRLYKQAVERIKL